MTDAMRAKQAAVLGSAPRSAFIGVVLDRSGSMNSIKTDMEEALNLFVKEQQAEIKQLKAVVCSDHPQADVCR